MDHSHMDHSGMGHSGMDHGGHGGGDMGDMCKMNMLFNWDTKNLCIVFSQWHIRSNTSLLFSLIAIMLLTIGYEALRAASHRYEEALTKRVQAIPSGEPITETTPILPGQNQEQAGERAHLIKGALYALQTFYAFMLMLIFMTYNGWVMIAVTLGAFVGYVTFGKRTSATKDNACH